MAFRKLARAKQALSPEECRALLGRENRGVLAVNGDDGYPYALPINFYYHEAEGAIYFHSGGSGYKLDAIKASDKVSFCVYDRGYRKDGHWSLNVQSVIAFGRLRAVEDWSEELMVAFSKQFTDDTEYIYGEIEKFKSSTVILRLEIEHITGKLVNEA